LTTHYFPTLYQFQFEYEDGYTPSEGQVRYQFADDIFPGFSKKGYAVFSPLQNEIINEVTIFKSSVYRLIIRFINPNEENVVGTILIQSDNPLEVDQHAKVLFRPSKDPQFVTVSGAKGEIPSPVVLDPGRYTISVKTDKPLFLDYFVLLPAAYYEASILTRKIDNPCEVDKLNLCRHYKYPGISEYNPILESYITEGEEAFKPNEFFQDYEHLDAVKLPSVPVLTGTQSLLNFLPDVPQSGRYILVVDYITHRKAQEFSVLQVQQKGETNPDGIVTLYPCSYTTACREPVIDKESREKVFFLDKEDLRPIQVVVSITLENFSDDEKRVFITFS
jgi:laminin, alpha 3/5